MSEKDALLSLPSEVINLTPFIKENRGEDVLRRMGDVVVHDYQQDVLSRAKWAENVAVSIKLFNSFMEKKTNPWPGCSSVVLPLLGFACLQFHARAYDALIPPRGVVNAIATGGEDVGKADRVAKYMNFQLLHEMEDFEEGMDKTLMQLPIEGSVFRKTYFDAVAGKVVSSYISAQDLVLPYHMCVGIDKVPRKTHVLSLSSNDINVRVKHGMYDEGALNLGPGSTMTSQVDSSIRDAADATAGIEKPVLYGDNPRVVLEQHRGWDLDDDSVDEPYVITVDLETQKVLRVTSRRFKNFLGEPIEIEYFTHYSFIPNPEGFYGLGFGALITGLNEAANDIVNNVIDAGHLANMQGGFISRRSGIKRGSLTFKMGEWKEVDTFMDDLSKALFTFNFQGPNQTLYAVLGLLFEYAKLISSVSETMTGQLPASDTPATTVMALIEEGRKVFSSVHKRTHRAFKKELQKIFRLNSIFLDQRKYFLLLGENGVPTGVAGMVGASDFASNIDVIPVSDPNITSRAEKVLKAQQVYTTTLTNPLTAQNPQAIYVATRKFYEALEIQNVDEVLPMPQPVDISPQEENAMFLQEKPSQVLPQQDHLHHISVHDEFVMSTFGEELTPQGAKLLEVHRREHVAGMYMLAEAERMKAQAQALELGARAGRLV